MTHTDLLMIVPSRGRPQSVEDMAKAWTATVPPPAVNNPITAELLYVIDDDDPALGQYADACETFGIRLLVGPRLRLGPTLNQVATRYTGSYTAVGFLGDDHRPRSNAWPARMLAELDRLGNGIVYGNDLIHGPNLPTAVVMSASIVHALGYMCPPGLIHLYLDNTWKSWGDGADCLTYLPDVVIEHMHPVASKSHWDAGYAEVNSDSMYAADAATFHRYRDSGGLAGDVAKIRGLRG